MADVSAWLESVGIPPRDLYDLPSSQHFFPDQAHYRIEISGVERLSTLDALLEEMEKEDVPVHRIISAVMGSTYLPRRELEEFARTAAQAGLEVIMTPGPRPLWDVGKQVNSPEGGLSGLRMRGSDSLRHLLCDIERSVQAGIRGFLVWDEGVLSLVNQLRTNGQLPPDVVFKVSIFAGHANAAGAKVLADLGANTFNPVADLTLPMLASIRKVVTLPMDVHVLLFDSFGGHNRMYECPEIARIASPVYFKIEPGPSVSALYKPSTPPDTHAFFIREKVRQAAIIREIVEKEAPSLRLSAMAPDDLALPKVP